MILAYLAEVDKLSHNVLIQFGHLMITSKIIILAIHIIMV